MTDPAHEHRDTDWIPVTERLPQLPGRPYRTKHGDGSTSVSFYDPFPGAVQPWTGSESIGALITHWKPLQ